MALPTFERKIDRKTQSGNRQNLIVADDINQILDCLTAFQTMFKNITVRTCVNITSLNFMGPYYTNPLLIGLTPGVDFRVFTNEGSGTLLLWDDDGYDIEGGYSYEPELGRLTMPIQGYSIEIYTKLTLL